MADTSTVTRIDDHRERHQSASVTAESIRLDLAQAWGEMGAAWGVTPAIARVQA